MSRWVPDRKWVIELIDKWLTLIHATAVDGELKLTPVGTESLINNLIRIRQYIESEESEGK